MIDISSSAWPDPTRAAIIAPGPHRSYLDGPTLALTTPRPIVFAVSPDFACHSVWRPILLSIGRIRGSSMVPMRPGSASGLRALLRHVQAGGWVCVFPEGGIETGREHPGIGWLARHSGAPIHRLRLRHGPGLGVVKPVVSFARYNDGFGNAQHIDRSARQVVGR